MRWTAEICPSSLFALCFRQVHSSISRKPINIMLLSDFLTKSTDLTHTFVLYTFGFCTVFVSLIFFPNIKGSAEFLSRPVCYWDNMSDLGQYLFSFPGRVLHLFHLNVSVTWCWIGIFLFQSASSTCCMWRDWNLPTSWIPLLKFVRSSLS